MSTTKIREALDLLQARHPEAYEKACREVEAIEVMALTIAGRKLDATEVRRSAELMQSIAENAPRR